MTIDVGMNIRGAYVTAWLLISIYTICKTSTTDAGVIEIVTNEDKKKELVLSLANKGELDNRRFCYTCCIRKPLRSKHCIYCNHCVVKFDQYYNTLSI